MAAKSALEASWGLLGGPQGNMAAKSALEASWGLLGGLLEPLGGLLGALWSFLGASEGLFQRKPSKAKLSQATVG